ncbi:nuclear transport factor 2 family protein [Micromonospora sp. NPDC048843]|uniref:nuclear transport factor 2 family protein n=1 Tax=Micromonospora sp. NPDC048843 TaxID=3155389 RepID=UPI0033F98CE5
MSALTVYINAWNSNDTESIAATVTPDAVVTESYGPVYHGQERIREWADMWFGRGSRVLNWVITNEFTSGDTTVAEWRFDYREENEDRSFEGLTIATVRDGKIAALREYATTADLYTWEGEWK